MTKRNEPVSELYIIKFIKLSFPTHTHTHTIFMLKKNILRDTQSARDSGYF